MFSSNDNFARLKTLEGTLDPSKCETLALALLDYERYSVEDRLVERVLNLCLADLAEIKSKAGAEFAKHKFPESIRKVVVCWPERANEPDIFPA